MILCGDIGATKSLLGLARLEADGSMRVEFTKRYLDLQWPSFDEVVLQFLDHAATALGEPVRIDAAGMGIAGPIEAGRVRMTNHPWTMDAEALSTLLGGAPVRLLNDFEASAHGIGDIDPAKLTTLQAGEPQAWAPQVVIGAGSGLGVALRLRGPRGAVVIGGEGGHIGFAPRDAGQLALWQFLNTRLGRVSAEHVVSGPGLARIHDWLAGEQGGEQAEAATAGLSGEAVWQRACSGSDARATRALDVFVDCYGAVAGDHALTVLAFGGVFLAGGIAPRILPGARTANFLAAFRDKGPHAALAARMPVHVVTDEQLPLLGAARAAHALLEDA